MTTSMIPKAGIDLRKKLTELEALYIEEALNKSKGNVKSAAEMLGMKRTTLSELIRRRGIKC